MSATGEVRVSPFDRREGGPPPLRLPVWFVALTFVAAIAVLVAGIAVALFRSSSSSTSTSVGSSVASSLSSSSSSSLPSLGVVVAGTLPTTTVATSASTSASSATSTTTAQQASQGLWTAYIQNDEPGAARFASPEVIQALFASPYDHAADPTSFPVCAAQDADVSVCKEVETNGRTFTMTAQRQADGGFLVVVIEFDNPVPTSSSSSTGTSSTTSTTTTTVPASPN